MGYRHPSPSGQGSTGAVLVPLRYNAPKDSSKPLTLMVVFSTWVLVTVTYNVDGYLGQGEKEPGTLTPLFGQSRFSVTMWFLLVMRILVGLPLRRL